MSLTDDIYDGLHDWVIAANSITTEGRVIPSDDKAPRPKVKTINDDGSITRTPYIAIDTVHLGKGIGKELIRGINPVTLAPTVATFEKRNASFTLDGFGGGAEDLILCAAATLKRPDIQAILNAAGINVRPQGDLIDLSPLVDTEIEKRYSMDFVVSFGLQTDPVDQVALETAQFDMTYEKFEGDPNAIVDSFTVDTT